MNRIFALLGSFIGMVVILIGSCGILSILTRGKIASLVDQKFLAVFGAIYLISTGSRAVRQGWGTMRLRGKDPSA